MMDLLTVETRSCFQVPRAKYLFHLMNNFSFSNF